MYRFKSLDIAVGFEDRVYTRGEEIDLSIMLFANRGTVWGTEVDSTTFS